MNKTIYMMLFYWSAIQMLKQKFMNVQTKIKTFVKRKDFNRIVCQNFPLTYCVRWWKNVTNFMYPNICHYKLI